MTSKTLSALLRNLWHYMECNPLKMELLREVRKIMKEMGFQGEVTPEAEIPAGMVNELTDELAMRLDKIVSFRAKLYSPTFAMSGVKVKDLLFE